MSSAKPSGRIRQLADYAFGERAFSLQTFLIVAIPAGLLAVVGDPARGLGSPWIWIGVVAAATAIAGFFFLAYGAVIFRFATGALRVVLGLIGFAGTGAMRGGLLGALGLQTGALDEVNWQFRFAGGVIVATVLFPLAATLVNDFAIYRMRLGDLSENQRRLGALTANAKAELEAQRALLLSDVNTRLGEAIERISAEALRGTSALGALRLAKSLLEAVEAVVRPLSKAVLVDRDDAIPSVTGGARPVSLKSLVFASTIAKPFRPGPVSLIWAVIGASTISALRPGFPGVLAYPLFVGSTWLLLAIGSRYIAPRLAHRGFSARLALILGWYFVAAGIPAVLSWLPLASIDRPGFGSLTLTLLVLDPVATMFLCVSLALLAGLRAERERILVETQAVNARLEWELAALKANLRALRKRISRSVHSDVQAVFIATAMRLQSAIKSGIVTPEFLDQLTQNLRAIGTVNPEPKEPPALADALAELRTFWGDSVDIGCDVPAEVAHVVVDNDLLRATLIDVCSEAVINAVKHAGARKIQMSLRPGNSVVSLLVHNDGSPVRLPISTGEGLRMMKEVSVEFELKNEFGGSLLRVVLPVVRGLED